MAGEGFSTSLYGRDSIEQRMTDDLNEYCQFAADLGYHPELRGGLAAELFDVGEPRMAIGLRLARSQHVEVGSVEHVDGLVLGFFRGFRHPGPGNEGLVV